MRIETERLIIRDLEQKDSTDMYECKRYAVALKENDLLIGTVASCKVAEKSGFELFEKRTPIGHKQPNMIKS